MKKVDRKYAARLPHYIRRILAVYNQTSDSDLTSGLAWYSRAQSAAKAIHPNLLIAAGVISALSPQTEWTINKRWARQVCNAALSGKMWCPRVATKDRARKAWKIANLENPTKETILAILNGPKTQRFFLNIIGDYQAVTIDVWAQRVATGKDLRPPKPGRNYDTLEKAYQIASNRLGIYPRDLQATVWTWIRGHAEYCPNKRKWADKFEFGYNS